MIKNNIGKVLMFTLILVITLSNFTVATYASDYGFDENINKFKSLNMIDKSMNFSKSDILTKEDFAIFLSYGLGLNNVAHGSSATKSVFSDVSITSKAGLNIEYLDALGCAKINNKPFYYPKEKMTYGEAKAMIVAALGYKVKADASGGYLVGYNVVANSVGLGKDLNIKDSSYITYEAAVYLLNDALEIPMMVQTKYGNESKYEVPTGVNEVTILNKYLKVSKETFKIKEVKEKSASVYMTDKSNNPITDKLIEINNKTSIDLNLFVEHIVTGFIDDDDNLLYIEPIQNQYIVYDYIKMINDKDIDVGYNISDISVLNKKLNYSSSSNISVSLDGISITNYDLLLNKFSKITLNKKDEVTSIEAYSLNEGGLIIDFKDTDKVRFVSDGQIILSDIFADVKDFTVVLNGELSSIAKLSSGTVFEYAKIDDKCIISASDKKVEGTINSYSDSSANIDEVDFDLNSVVYYTKDDSIYTATNDLKDLFGQKITAFITPDGKIAFLKTGGLTQSYFIGYVKSTAVKMFDEKCLNIYEIQGSSIKKSQYYTTNLKQSEIKFEDVVYTAGTYEGIYKFYKNSENRIYKIEPMEWRLNNTGGTTLNVSELYFGGYINFSNSGTRLYTDASTTILDLTAMNDDDMPQMLTWSDIRGMQPSGAQIKALDSDSITTFIVLLNKTTDIIPKYKYYGIVDKVSYRAVDGEAKKVLAITTCSDNNKVKSAEYIIDTKKLNQSSLDKIANIKAGDAIQFTEGGKMIAENEASGDGVIRDVTNVYTLEDIVNALNSAPKVIKNGQFIWTDEKKSDFRKYVDTVNIVYFLEKNSEGKNILKRKTFDEVMTGDSIFKGYTGSGNRVVIIKR